MLKELGLFVDAAESYGRALSLAPNNPETHLQLGFLSKITGDLPEALRFLRRARELGYEPIGTVEKEIRLCTRRRSISLLSVSSDKKTRPLRVYLSSITGMPFEENGGEIRKRIGGTHYSYAFIMKGFIAALEMLEIPYQVIRNPEFIPNIAERSDAEINVHIGFYPPEDMRFLKGAYNVLSVAWEFERLRSAAETLGYHAFADTVPMFDRADEIWSISSFGADALRRSGLRRVEAVPTPILGGRRAGRRVARPNWGELEHAASVLGNIGWLPISIAPNIQSTVHEEAERRGGSLQKLLFESDEFSESEEGPPDIFLSVFNVHDYRKQIRPLIEAFIQYSQANRNAYLLLKITKAAWVTDALSDLLLGEQIYDPGELYTPFVSDRIWMTSDALTRDQMQSLYDCAGFYVCTSHAEGQNLPMLEAMARGVVPVSVDNTSMANYIRSDNAIVIPSTFRPLTQRLARRYGLFGVSTWYVAAEDVYAALGSAVEMSSETYAAYSTAASRTIDDQFGIETLRTALDRVIVQHAAPSTGEGG
jgi:glycosyltransferase involved in cell wall biosynthesis